MELPKCYLWSDATWVGMVMRASKVWWLTNWQGVGPEGEHNAIFTFFHFLQCSNSTMHLLVFLFNLKLVTGTLIQVTKLWKVDSVQPLTMGYALCVPIVEDSHSITPGTGQWGLQAGYLLTCKRAIRLLFPIRLSLLEPYSFNSTFKKRNINEFSKSKGFHLVHAWHKKVDS